jgi:predicted kinase
MKQPKLVVLAGPACSGKSTLGGIFAMERDWPYLAMDATRVRLLPESHHTRDDRAVAYRAMHLCAELLLAHDKTTILDAPYGHREDREDVAALLTRTGASFHLIECAVTPETAVERFHARLGTHPGLDLTEERVRRIVREYRFSDLGLLLETSTLSLDECLTRLRDYLDRSQSVNPDHWAASIE